MLWALVAVGYVTVAGGAYALWMVTAMREADKVLSPVHQPRFTVVEVHDTGADEYRRAA